MTADTPARVIEWPIATADEIAKWDTDATEAYRHNGDELAETHLRMSATLRALTQAQAERIADYEDAMADKRRLAREIDVAMHGEEGAAKQASLCDLIEPARMMRERIAALETGQNTAIEAMMEAQRARRAAESSLAETRAKVERVKGVLRRARHHLVCLHASTPQQVSLIDDIDAALSALPEAKPAAQADDAAPEVKP